MSRKEHIYPRFYFEVTLGKSLTAVGESSARSWPVPPDSDLLIYLAVSGLIGLEADTSHHQLSCKLTQHRTNSITLGNCPILYDMHINDRRDEMTFIELSEVLGNLGDFVGSVAVLVTLIYLAVQVRHSRDLLEENKKIGLSQVSLVNAGFRLELQRYQAEPHMAQIRARVEQGEALYNNEHKINFDERP